MFEGQEPGRAGARKARMEEISRLRARLAELELEDEPTSRPNDAPAVGEIERRRGLSDAGEAEPFGPVIVTQREFQQAVMVLESRLTTLEGWRAKAEETGTPAALQPLVEDIAGLHKSVKDLISTNDSFERRLHRVGRALDAAVEANNTLAFQAAEHEAILKGDGRPEGWLGVTLRALEDEVLALKDRSTAPWLNKDRRLEVMEERLRTVEGLGKQPGRVWERFKELALRLERLEASVKELSGHVLRQSRGQVESKLRERPFLGETVKVEGEAPDNLQALVGLM